MNDTRRRMQEANKAVCYLIDVSFMASLLNVPMSPARHGHCDEPSRRFLFALNGTRWEWKMEQDLASALRERALSALEMSTTMLTVSENLLRQGNQREAARLRNEA